MILGREPDARFEPTAFMRWAGGCRSAGGVGARGSDGMTHRMEGAQSVTER